MRPLVIAVAAMTLLAAALVFAPLGASHWAVGTLSPTPPVPLPPARGVTTTPSSGAATGTTPASSTTTTTAPAPGATTATPARPVLPKTGIDVWPIALVGVCLLTAGAALRGAARPRVRARR